MLQHVLAFLVNFLLVLLCLADLWRLFGIRSLRTTRRGWACDFLPVIDLFFCTIYIFFIIELSSRRVVHFGVTRDPTDIWVAQQLRIATPYDQAPRFLLRDNDRKFESAFASVAKASGIEVLRILYRAPPASAVCERFVGSDRRECLDL